MDEARKIAREEANRIVEPLRTTLWGPRHPSGDGRVTAQGMEHKLNEVHTKVTNGGMTAKVTGWQMERKTKVYLALIGLAQAVLVAGVIGAFALITGSG